MPHALFIMMLALNAGQTPSEPPAALRRPNLQVLKTMPESQLFPVMNALADSLGVRCDHCHVRINPDPTRPGRSPAAGCGIETISARRSWPEK
jgi:hypothetical protein